jgi:hypothetical protein
MANGLTREQEDFLSRHHSAAMITVNSLGTAKVARVGVALVDGQVWSSGTQARVRTRRLRQDPRSSLFVFGGGFGWLTLESTVTILDGPNAAELNVRLFRTMQNRPEGPLSWFGGELDENAFRTRMIEEKRLVYQFEVRKAYGMVERAGDS